MGQNQLEGRPPMRRVQPARPWPGLVVGSVFFAQARPSSSGHKIVAAARAAGAVNDWWGEQRPPVMSHP
jgi:hypothetical protein